MHIADVCIIIEIELNTMYHEISEMKLYSQQVKYKFKLIKDDAKLLSAH